MKKSVLNVLVSMGVSAAVFALLFTLASHGGRGVTPGDILACLRNAVVGLVVVYAVCQLIQTLLRALRNRMLLKAGMADDRRDSVPGLRHITLVTFVRGACADMLPMRVGELSYVAMLNRGCNIPFADGMTSLSIGLLLDFAALLVVLTAAVVTISQGLSLLGSAILLLLVCLVGWTGLFHIMPWFAALLTRRSPKALMEWRIFGFHFYAWAVRLLRDMSTSVHFVATSGAMLPVLGLSAAIRFVKYFSLYWLFIAVTRGTWPHMASADVPSVLVALISAEGAASLPVPSFMSFGSYEAGGALALTALGFGLAEAITAMLAMHLISQTIDYSLGGIAFLAFIWLPGAGETRARRPRGRAVTAVALSAAVIVILAVLAIRMSETGSVDPGAVEEQSKLIGDPVTPKNDPAQRTDFKGRMVWSSNRSGSHDIHLVELPSGRRRRLTSSAFTDTYPLFSPDGRGVAFSRSHLPFVSQRDPLKWDTWILDLDSGRETRVATNAFTAIWHPDGELLVYVRDGGSAIPSHASCASPGTPATIAGRMCAPSSNPLPFSPFLLVLSPEGQEGREAPEI